MKEETIALFKQKEIRLQLVKITNSYIQENGTFKNFQIRHNRKVINKSNNEYYIRKVFANIINNTILQTTINYD